MFKLVKLLGAFILAVALLIIMTPWSILTSLMAIVFDKMNKSYAKLVDFMIKTGEGL